MSKSLVIVESPAKTKKIAGFLGSGFTVLATMGHIRALEEDLAAVGLDRDFEPRYRFLNEKKGKAIKAIQEAAADADTIYLAADDDREGEAIAYSVACLLKKDPASLPRAVFHEITAKAVKAAIANPRRLDMNRVLAQQARAVLDLMVGYTISPCLWKHVARALSAGRCQTPALRLVWDREEIHRNHSSTTSWSLTGDFLSSEHAFTFPAKMNDELEDQESAMNYLENVVENSAATVSKAVNKPWSLNPPKPLITSTLQQEASALHGLNPQSTMKIAQSLYEAGHITYMRTDHAVLSEEAIAAAHEYVKENHGAAYVGLLAPTASASSTREPAKKKGKGKKAAEEKPEAPQAQEAHECIRPTHFEVSELPQSEWKPEERKVYALIWRRAVQATMAAARGLNRIVELTLEGEGGAPSERFVWSAAWRKTEFEGWQILGKTAKLDDDSDEANEPAEDKQEKAWKQASKLEEGTRLNWKSLQATPKYTRPPPRFNEATLIRELEQKGIGRPSTFASLVETLFDKKYIEKQDISGNKATQTTLLLKPGEWPPSESKKQITQGAEKGKLVPTALGESVLTFCLREFPQLFAYEFTAKMEGQLDSVAKGDMAWKDICKETWNSYKSDYERLSAKGGIVEGGGGSDKVRELGEDLKAIMSKNGPLLVLENAGQSKNKEDSKAIFYTFPPGKSFTTLTLEEAKAHIASLKEKSDLGLYDGHPIEKKKGPYGYYIQWSTFKIPCDEADSREVVVEKIKAKQVSAANQHRVGPYVFSSGQYGPYMYKDGLKTKTFISVNSAINVKELTLPQAEDMYKKGVEEKKANGTGGWRGGRGGSARGGRGGR